MVRLTALSVALAVAGLDSAPLRASCADMLPASAPTRGLRDVTPSDLLGLRDIGYPEPVLAAGPSPLAVSPDARAVAFVLRRADAARNAYCHALVVLDLRAGGRPRIVDHGGELITLTDVQRGMFVRGGVPALNTPIWSPDVLWLAYRKRVNGSTQVWRVRAAGDQAKQITHAPSDVEGLAWSEDGRALLYATRPALPALNVAITREGEKGWLYDARVVTFSGPRPQIRAANAPLAGYAVDLARDSPRPATASELIRLDLPGVEAIASLRPAVSPQGARAALVPDSSGIMAPGRLTVTQSSGRTMQCPHSACRGGIIAWWWSTDGTGLFFVRRQGWNEEESALYRWRPGATAPRRLLLTTDALIGCVPAAEDAICTRESARRPRHLVRIALSTGHVTELFDPNPEFRRLRIGRVERLRVRSNLGLPAWADLVLPPGHRPGTKLPLVVVQYTSRGFLRGGSGDEVPILALAARGYAVLSFEKAPFAASLDPSLKDWTAVTAANERGWRNRRSLLSAIEAAVRITIARGIVDPERVGITGLSDGSTTTRFALINSTLFAAASISTCCLEPWTVNTYAGIAFADFIQASGYPSLRKPKPDFWRAASLSLNADRIDTPLLMQLNDDDGHLLALEAYMSLREAGKPVEMYVFPDEYHFKWQPVHRRAIYDRNLDWFDFWLRGIEHPDPDKAEQYRRWRAFRAPLRAEQKPLNAPSMSAPKSPHQVGS